MHSDERLPFVAPDGHTHHLWIEQHGGEEPVVMLASREAPTLEQLELLAQRASKELSPEQAGPCRDLINVARDQTNEIPALARERTRVQKLGLQDESKKLLVAINEKKKALAAIMKQIFGQLPDNPENGAELAESVALHSVLEGLANDDIQKKLEKISKETIRQSGQTRALIEWREDVLEEAKTGISTLPLFVTLPEKIVTMLEMYISDFRERQAMAQIIYDKVLAATKDARIDLAKRVAVRVTTDDSHVSVERGYPFGFQSKRQFQEFSIAVLGHLAEHNIPASDVRIQGSAVRIPTPRDFDIASFVSHEEYEAFADRCALEISQESMRGPFAKHRKSGHINSFFFPRTGGKETFNMVLHDLKAPLAVDLSVVDLDGGFNEGPFISMNAVEALIEESGQSGGKGVGSSTEDK